MTFQTAGRFTLLRKLPAGGMGRVFEAEDPANKRRVALKLIDLGSDSDSLQIVNAERLGAELQKRLCAVDKRVAQIHEFGAMPNYFYIVMEYVDGRDISEIAAGEGIPPAFAARIAHEVLEVLDCAHSFTTNIEGRAARGIVHGDVKPRNIRLTPSGQVKMLDFGIAKALSMTRSFTQNVFGSIQYSSPERLANGDVDVSSDLWGVGVVLYELLAGHPYFEAESGSKLEHMIRNYRELQPLPASWPEPLRHVVARALDPDPQVRYSTAAEFVAALAPFRSIEAGNQSDVEATRRVAQNADATARTPRPYSPAAGAAEAEATRKAMREQPHFASNTGFKPVAVASALPRKHTFRRNVLRGFVISILASLLAVAYLCVSEYMVWRNGGQLAHDLTSEKQQDLNAAWQQYAQLSSRSYLPVSLWSAQDALRDRFMSDADHTIARYREADGPPVLESDWVHARGEVARALELAPGDKTIHGKLRLIDGHLARIRGSARHDAGLLQESRQDFEDAANFMKKSADPWLGLARLYIYSLHDVEHGEAAIKEAERRGHDIGKRETAELADGYRYQAERTMAVGDRATSEADAERYYDLASTDLARAQKLYESIVPWGGTGASLKKVDESQSHIALRRSTMRGH